MKKLSYLLMSIVVLLTSCSSNDYGIKFALGDTEQKTIDFLQDNSIENRYEKNGDSTHGIIRVKNYEFEGMDFNTIRLGFENGKLYYMQYRVHDKDNIDKVLSYLKDKFGNPKENNNHNKNTSLAQYYWGGINENFMIIENYDDDYIKVHVGDGTYSDVSVLYKDLIVGD